MYVDLDWLLNESKLIKRTRALPYEVLHVILINKEGKLIPLQTIETKGNQEFSVKAPNNHEELKRKYDEHNGVALVYIHNHPNDCYDTFTASDLMSFSIEQKRLASKGMNLIDLLVVSKDSHYSLKELSQIL